MPASVEAALDLCRSGDRYALAQRKTARERAERALALYSELDDPLRVAQARHLLGRALVDLGDIEEGENMLASALKEARAVGVRSVIADILQSIAVARNHAGDLAGARPLFAEALAMFRSVGAERVCSHIAGNLAEAEFHEGNAVEALRLENEALATYRTFNHKLGAAISLCNTCGIPDLRSNATTTLAFPPEMGSQPHATRNGRPAYYGVCSISQRPPRYAGPTMRSACAAIGSALRGF